MQMKGMLVFNEDSAITSSLLQINVEMLRVKYEASDE